MLMNVECFSIFELKLYESLILEVESYFMDFEY